MRVITSRGRAARTATSKALNGAMPELAERMQTLLIGQDDAIRTIVPYVQMHQVGLSARGRPVGVILLLGPSGTGKTKTVESLATLLHGNARALLKIDCGEYQMDHEVAKLIGAPPGYLGHRDTVPLLTQAKLNAITSDNSGLSLLLFDEIEKAAPSFTRLLLGVLDKATLRLGDNNVVNFERSLIFMTSNLGSTEMKRAVDGGIGFHGVAPTLSAAAARRIAVRAVGRKFSAEFINRIDEVVTYAPLTPESLEAILSLELVALRAHLAERLAEKQPELDVTAPARAWLIDHGVSAEFGARPLRRLIQTRLLQPIAVALGEQDLTGATVRVEVDDDDLTIRVVEPKKK